MKKFSLRLKQSLIPYIYISFAGLIAFAPLSFMIKAVKNDIIALEYPINYFMSQCIHNGEIPYWFNTWGMGFPLYSNLTWGIFSTPRILFSSIFNYNIYILHIEFMFFILLAGWSMYYLLNKYIINDKTISQLLAICYMLSGFMVGSTQWLLYITAASFIPLLIISVLKLLNSPSFKTALQFAIIYTLMFTSVYAAFNIITTYLLIIFLIIWSFIPANKKKITSKIIIYFLIGGILTLILCLPVLYYTIELLGHIERGNSITNDATFFNSNYLHPGALSSMLLPFSSVKMNYVNTEGTMLHTYLGIFTLILLPVAFWNSLKEKKRFAILILCTGLLFLLFAFGELTPFRNALNAFPGFSYFRNPAIFRLYFIIALILFIGISFQNKSFESLFYKNNSESKIIRNTIWLLILACIIIFIFNFAQFKFPSFSSINNFIKNINCRYIIILSSSLQLAILIVLLFSLKFKYIKITKFILTADIVLNALICTPFFSVSSYSIPEANQILHSTEGFPLQNERLNVVASTFTDHKKNTWYNVNVFNKKISSNESYRGPLTLNSFYSTTNDTTIKNSIFNNQFVFLQNNTENEFLQILSQKPTKIRIKVRLNKPNTLFLLQNYYTGWTATYNNKNIKIIKDENPGMKISIPKGEALIEFNYERKWVWIFALLLHLIIICFFGFLAYPYIKNNIKLSFPSRQ